MEAGERKKNPQFYFYPVSTKMKEGIWEDYFYEAFKGLYHSLIHACAPHPAKIVTQLKTTVTIKTMANF